MTYFLLRLKGSRGDKVGLNGLKLSSTPRTTQPRDHNQHHTTLATRSSLKTHKVGDFLTYNGPENEDMAGSILMKAFLHHNTSSSSSRNLQEWNMELETPKRVRVYKLEAF